MQSNIFDSHDSIYRNKSISPALQVSDYRTSSKSATLFILIHSISSSILWRSFWATTLLGLSIGLLVLLDQALKQRSERLGTLLGIPRLSVLVIDKGDAETGLVTLSPLKVVEKRPGKVAVNINAIECGGISHGSDIIIVVLQAEVILKDLLLGHIILTLDASAVLSHVHLRETIAAGQPDEKVAEARGTGSQPGGLGLGTDAIATLVPEVKLQVSKEVVLGGLAVDVLDVVGSVVVHTVEVVGALDKGSLLISEGGKSVTELSAHRLGVLAKVDGVSEPRDGKLDLAVSGLNILGVKGIPWEGTIAVQDNTNLTTIGSLEVIAVSLDSTTVGDEKVVADNPGLAGRVADVGLGAVRSVTGGEGTGAVSEDGRAPGLVEGDPVLAAGNTLEDNASVVLVVERELSTVQETTVAAVKLIRSIPVEEGNEGSDAHVKEVIDKLAVVGNTGLVNGVVSATLGNDSGP